jgi:hypothetical protein
MEDSRVSGKRASKGTFAWVDGTLSSDSTNYTLFTLGRPKQDSKKGRRGGGGSREEHQRSKPFRAYSSSRIFGNALTKSRLMTLNDDRPSNFTIVLYDDENTDTSISLKEPIFNYKNSSSSSDSGSGRNTYANILTPTETGAEAETETETERVHVHSREYATSVVSSNSSDDDDDDLSSPASGEQEEEKEEEDNPLCW